MEQPIYQFLQWTAQENGLLELFLEQQTTVLALLAVVALLACFFGFYIYRFMNAALVFCAIALCGRLFLEPRWGAMEAITFISVVGITVGFLAYRWYKLGAVCLSGVVTATWIWQLMGSPESLTVLSVVLMVLAAAAAGVLTYHFPLWSVYGFTALWGGITAGQMGTALISALPAAGSAAALILGLVLAAAGGTAQYFLFRNQKIFTKIMPEKVQYKLEQRKKVAA